jgi:hypothetical protein
MTTPKDNGGPAFPVAPTMNPDGSVWYHGKDGMTLRDYFATAAMQGMKANPLWDDNLHESIAAAAYHMADEMLTARKEGA